jgi:hypothetical protein
MMVSQKVGVIVGLILLFLMSFSFSLSSQEEKPVSGLVSFIKEKSGLEIRLEDLGWTWNEEDARGTQEQGSVSFSDRKWLMYLIHWGSIQTQEITSDYVKQRMLKMWGVKFEFSGKKGKTTISGHDAVWVEAYGTNKIFYSRFIIWNCPQSNREFIADTNYNLRYKTPIEDFERETQSAHSIVCHEGAPAEHSPELTDRFVSQKYDLSFDYPEAWFIADSPFYVPFPEYEGIRDKRMVSLLGLPSDENISVTLKWYPLETGEETIVMGISRNIMESLKTEVESEVDVERIQGMGFESFSSSGGKVNRIWGVIKLKNLEDKTLHTDDGIFQAAQWDLKEKGKKIVVILKTKKLRYGISTSSPDRAFQDRFLKELINNTF